MSRHLIKNDVAGENSDSEDRPRESAPDPADKNKTKEDIDEMKKLIKTLSKDQKVIKGEMKQISESIVTLQQEVKDHLSLIELNILGAISKEKDSDGSVNYISRERTEESKRNVTFHDSPPLGTSDRPDVQLGSNTPQDDFPSISPDNPEIKAILTPKTNDSRIVPDSTGNTPEFRSRQFSISPIQLEENENTVDNTKDDNSKRRKSLVREIDDDTLSADESIVFDRNFKDDIAAINENDSKDDDQPEMVDVGLGASDGLDWILPTSDEIELSSNKGKTKDDKDMNANENDKHDNEDRRKKSTDKDDKENDDNATEYEFTKPVSNDDWETFEYKVVKVLKKKVDKEDSENENAGKDEFQNKGISKSDSKTRGKEEAPKKKIWNPSNVTSYQSAPQTKPQKDRQNYEKNRTRYSVPEYHSYPKVNSYASQLTYRKSNRSQNSFPNSPTVDEPISEFMERQRSLKKEEEKRERDIIERSISRTSAVSSAGTGSTPLNAPETFLKTSRQNTGDPYFSPDIASDSYQHF